MGSSETATATTGGPRVIDVFDGNGAPSAPIIYFVRMQIGPRTSAGVALIVGKRLHRIRHRCSSLVLSESPGSHCQAIHGNLGSIDERIGRLCPEPGRMRCRRLRTSNTIPQRPQGDLRATNRQDSAGAAAMAGPSISRIKKIPFSAPSKCPTDPFGPLANRTALKRLHGVFCSAS